MNRQKQKCVPKLRFPEFQDVGGWKKDSLKIYIEEFREKSTVQDEHEVLTSSRGGLVRQREYYDNNRITERNNIGFNIVPPNYITYRSRSDDGLFFFNLNSLEITGLISVYYPVFKIIGGENIFFIYLFSHFAEYIGKNSVGNAQKVLSLNELRKVILPIPSPPEQKKIADCLSSIDDLITAQGKKVAALKSHKKGLMQQLFPAEGQTVPAYRFPEYQDAGDWEEMPLGKTATFYNGKAYTKEELLEQGKYRVLRVGNFFTNNHWYYSNLELDDTKYCDKGDLLYAWSASFGPRIWHGEKVIYHYHIWKVVEKKAINKNFLFVVLDYETERMKSKSANGLGLLHITKSTIENWLARFPKQVEEQQKIADCLSSLDDLITTHTKKLDALKNHKKGLMQQLFPTADDMD